jgi:adenylosuccinate lyase
MAEPEQPRQPPHEARRAGLAHESPLSARYATAAMLENLSPRRRALLWRDLWIALADAQRKLGLPIDAAQVEALRGARDRIDERRVAELETSVRHDVMAHVRHFGEQAGEDAARIVHLGATSCFVTDNADLVVMRDGLELLMDRLHAALSRLRVFAQAHRDVPVVAYTHFQPAQLTTMGKRACLWAFDLALDLDTLAALRERLPFRGVKGTTGTQASFLALFGGDHEKVRQLDLELARAFDFGGSIPVTGQTYTRKVDTWVVSALADVAGSAAKMAVDLRLLAHEGELEEPFEEQQVGSSAMAYKKNPMRCERICSLARFVHSLATSPRETHANQWLERTLDDSANRRLVLTEAFLAVDAILNLVVDVVAGLAVHPVVIAQNVARELPWMVTEEVIVLGTRAGGNRQELHERIRQLSRQVAAGLSSGRENDLIERMRADPVLSPHVHESALDPRRYVGRAPEQVDEFVRDHLDPLLSRHAHREGRFRARVRV